MLINFNVNTFEDYKDFNCKDKLLKNYKVSLGVKRNWQSKLEWLFYALHKRG